MIPVDRADHCSKVFWTDRMNQIEFFGTDLIGAPSDTESKKDCLVKFGKNGSLKNSYCAPDSGVHLVFGIVGKRYVVAFTGLTSYSRVREESSTTKSNYSIWRLSAGFQLLRWTILSAWVRTNGSGGLSHPKAQTASFCRRFMLNSSLFTRSPPSNGTEPPPPCQAKILNATNNRFGKNTQMPISTARSITRDGSGSGTRHVESEHQWLNGWRIHGLLSSALVDVRHRLWANPTCCNRPRREWWNR
jgi:hypothetical protein